MQIQNEKQIHPSKQYKKYVQNSQYSSITTSIFLFARAKSTLIPFYLYGNEERTQPKMSDFFTIFGGPLEDTDGALVNACAKAEGAAPSLSGPGAFTDEAFVGWEIGRQFLGRGSFGAAYRATLRDGRTVCVKAVELARNIDPEGIADLRNEMEVMKRLSHPNVVEYYGFVEDREERMLNIFMEYVDGGSLASHARALNAHAPLSEGTIRDWSRQMLCGVKYLHDNNIVHRDIKGDNILVSKKDGVLKLADFGRTNVIYDLSTKTYVRRSTADSLYWMAPEVITDGGYGQKCDIWSVGCTIVEVITGEPAWPFKENPFCTIYHIAIECEDKLPSFFAKERDYLSPEFIELLKRMFERAQSQRPSAAELLDDPLYTASPVGVLAVPNKEKRRACESSRRLSAFALPHL